MCSQLLMTFLNISISNIVFVSNKYFFSDIFFFVINEHFFSDIFFFNIIQIGHG